MILRRYRPGTSMRLLLSLVTVATALACLPPPINHRSAAHRTVQQGQESQRSDASLLSLVIDNARLMLVDGKGARTGLDPDSGKQLHEIPRSFVTVDAIDNDVTGERAKSFTVTVSVEEPAEREYRVTVVGLGRGASTLIVSAWAADGTAQPALRVPLPLMAKVRTDFRLQFVPTPDGRPRLERLTPGGPP